MMTLSGQLLTLEDGTPTLSDIARGLSRIPRFVGQTDEPWTVAHHSLVVANLADHQPDDEQLILHGLLHDAHEMMTGDIPTTFKTFDMRCLQEQLDKRIYAAFGLPRPSPCQRQRIKDCDRQALLAEAYVLTPRHTYERIASENEDAALYVVTHLVHDIRRYTSDDAGWLFEKLADLLIQKWGTT
jgi:hypothetical protein